MRSQPPSNFTGTGLEKCKANTIVGLVRLDKFSSKLANTALPLLLASHAVRVPSNSTIHQIRVRVLSDRNQRYTVRANSLRTIRVAIMRDASVRPTQIIIQISEVGRVFFTA